MKECLTRMSLLKKRRSSPQNYDVNLSDSVNHRKNDVWQKPQPPIDNVLLIAERQVVVHRVDLQKALAHQQSKIE